MKYMGSKNRIANEILPIILKNKQPNQWYVEPFVGGGNLIDKVDGKRIGADFNKYVIEALKLIRDNLSFLPIDNSETSEELYKQIKNNDIVVPIGLRGYYGFALSYGGKWFGGWCRDKAEKRDYISESYRNACKQSSNLQGIRLIHSSFNGFRIPSNSTIYCDPPYQNTTKYSMDFNYEIFYEWCRDMKAKGHNIFISEYTMPDDFKCIWNKEIVSSLTSNTGSKKGVEKLFTL